jgi:hypothetical protein
MRYDEPMLVWTRLRTRGTNCLLHKCKPTRSLLYVILGFNGRVCLVLGFKGLVCDVLGFNGLVRHVLGFNRVPWRTPAIMLLAPAPSACGEQILSRGGRVLIVYTHTRGVCVCVCVCVCVIEREREREREIEGLECGSYASQLRSFFPQDRVGWILMTSSHKHRYNQTYTSTHAREHTRAYTLITRMHTYMPEGVGLDVGVVIDDGFLTSAGAMAAGAMTPFNVALSTSVCIVSARTCVRAYVRMRVCVYI